MGKVLQKKQLCCDLSQLGSSDTGQTSSHSQNLSCFLAYFTGQNGDASNPFKFLKARCGVWLLCSLINHSCLPNARSLCPTSQRWLNRWSSKVCKIFGLGCKATGRTSYVFPPSSNPSNFKSSRSTCEQMDMAQDLQTWDGSSPRGHG